MRTRGMTVILSMLALLLATPVAGGEAEEATLDILVGTLQANRKAMVAVNLNLEDAEAKAFWPVYDRYDAERAQVRDRLVAIIEDYSANFGALGGEKATQLVEDYLAVERDRLGVRQRYLEKFSAALPPRQVLRFYQIENKIDAVLRYKLSESIPVIEE